MKHELLYRELKPGSMDYDALKSIADLSWPTKSVRCSKLIWWLSMARDST